MSTVIIDSSVLKSIREALCKYPAECGGVIACNSDGIIVDFYFGHVKSWYGGFDVVRIF